MRGRISTLNTKTKNSRNPKPKGNPDGRTESFSRSVKLYSEERPIPEGIHSDGRGGIDTLDQNK